jgi:hypothetical protein
MAMIDLAGKFEISATAVGQSVTRGEKIALGNNFKLFQG